MKGHREPRNRHPRAGSIVAQATPANWAVRLFVLAAVVLLLAACASPAQRANMEVSSVVQVNKNEYSVAVSVAGGTQLDSGAALSISNEDFKAAVEASLARSGSFGKVLTTPAGTGYQLSANIIEVHVPLSFASVSAEMEVAWTLRRQRDDAVLLRKAIRSSYTAGAFAAFAGVTRVRLAIEGAARKSIESLLKELAAVEL